VICSAPVLVSGVLGTSESLSSLLEKVEESVRGQIDTLVNERVNQILGPLLKRLPVEKSLSFEAVDYPAVPGSSVQVAPMDALPRHLVLWYVPPSVNDSLIKQGLGRLTKIFGKDDVVIALPDTTHIDVIPLCFERVGISHSETLREKAPWNF
jgi:hypothetical protein